tara:strand:+ start:45 stop:221 length:177 start_codon:yes stop_codon:yes gene_type:complete
VTEKIKANAIKVDSQLSKENILLNLMDKDADFEIDKEVARIKPNSCPISSIKPLLKPL